MRLSTRLWRRLRDQGPTYVARESIPHLHRHHLRPRLPRRWGTVSGVWVKCYHAGDQWVPWRLSGPAGADEYEHELIQAIHHTLKPGDDVLLIGGGWGVSAVHAADAVGPTGLVTVYEASPDQATHVRETTENNGVSDRVSVETSAVGPAKEVHGMAARQTVFPEELPAVDAAVLDCEGAESAILPHLRASRAVVETHGCFGSPTDAARTELNKRGYTVTEQGTVSAEQDVVILSAHLNDE